MLCFCRAGYRSAMTMLAVALLTTVAVSYHLRRVTPFLPLATGRTASTRLRSPAEKARNPPRQNTGSVQIPIAPDAPPSPHLPRFPPLEVCVRRPPGARRATFVGPPSANLHRRRHMHRSKLSHLVGGRGAVWRLFIRPAGKRGRQNSCSEPLIKSVVRP